MRNPNEVTEGKTAFMARQERMMDETTQDSINVRIAKLLGWRVMIAAVGRWALLNPDGVAIYRYGANEAAAWRHVPDCKHSLDPTIAVLTRHDATLVLDFGPAYAATIIPEGRANEPPLPRFTFGNGDVYRQEQRQPEMAELAAMALEAYLLWRQEQEAGDA